jgi:hypothetical protein
MNTAPLQSARNTRAVELRIRSAARQIIKHRNLDTFFEHGQWWIRHTPTGATWSVVDAEGGRSVLGFDFEQVTEGDEADR